MKLYHRCLPLGCLLALASLSGCSSGLEGVEKRLSSMQDEITKLQNQNDRLVERVDAMEVKEVQEAKEAKAAPAKPAPTATTSERPSLKVVKVVPDDDAGMPSSQAAPQAPGDAVDDPSPRPVIRVRGGGSSKTDGKSEAKSES